MNAVYELLNDPKRLGSNSAGAKLSARHAGLADRIAKPFLVVALFAAALSAWLAWSVSPSHALMVALAVLIVAFSYALIVAQVDTVVFDKTGTLTHDRFELQAMYTEEGAMDANQLRSPVSKQLLCLAASMAQYSSHPYSRAVVQLSAGLALGEGLTGVAETVGQGLSGNRIRSYDPLIVETFRMGSLSFCESWFGHSAVPLLAAVSAQVHLCNHQGWLASFAFHEELRPDALENVQALQAHGIEVFLMSGDTAPAVNTVAKRLHLPPSNVLAQCSPQGKLLRVKALQALDRRVAVVGDGFNDMVVKGPHLLPVLQRLTLAKRIRRVANLNLVCTCVYNAVCVPLAFMGHLQPWLAVLGMALSSMVVVMYSLQLAMPSRWHLLTHIKFKADSSI